MTPRIYCSKLPCRVDTTDEFGNGSAHPTQCGRSLFRKMKSACAANFFVQRGWRPYTEEKLDGMHSGEFAMPQKANKRLMPAGVRLTGTKKNVALFVRMPLNFGRKGGQQLHGASRQWHGIHVRACVRGNEGAIPEGKWDRKALFFSSNTLIRVQLSIKQLLRWDEGVYM